MKNNQLYKNYIKRIIDILVAVTFIALFWWLLLIIAVLVRINMGSPVLYTTERVGKDERIFRIYKFRSMTNEVDENGVLLPGNKRLTKFGGLLRSTSLDELPSLINVLKGELSIVGPRPLPVKYMPYYYDHERIRHSVNPGLTGWAQINGRNAITWDHKFELDIEYVNNISFLFDIKVILLTAWKVIKRSDIIQDDQQTGSLYIVRKEMNRVEGD
ncbi:sugar transferase [Hungatella sp. L12]|uniref:Sugar transferase n=1 Tax=Hungatella hominis TaxID=2763050 RepID=A0ABR7H1U1_9FIRM|nr:sugar transferase [Hungatella hominis]MBC5707132.1 sugar transferase [Hungatella hominis]